MDYQIEQLQKIIDDLSEKAFIAQRDNKPIYDEIIEDIQQAKDLLKAMKGE